MLYISRFVGQSKYGVVDTDDGTETIITHKELWEYCIDLHMDIKGVRLGTTVSRNKEKLCIKDVDVYQCPDFVTKEQAKLNVLRGITIKTYGSQIVSVFADRNVVPKGTRVRLSDYGTSCGEYILKGMPYGCVPIVTLVLDDKIAITGKSLKYFPDRCMCVDMHEVKSQKTVDFVCRELVSSSRILNTVWSVVLDTADRMDYYIGVAVLNRSGNQNPEITNIGDIVSNSVNTNRLIAKRFRREFESISKAQFMAIKNNRWATTAKEFAKWLANPLNAGLMTFHDYKSLRMSNFINIFKVLRELSTSNKSVLTRFENYVKYFDATPEIQQAYIHLCESAGNWLLQYAKSVHWI